jgi:hypothetical protein
MHIAHCWSLHMHLYIGSLTSGFHIWMHHAVLD